LIGGSETLSATATPTRTSDMPTNAPVVLNNIVSLSMDCGHRQRGFNVTRIWGRRSSECRKAAGYSNVKNAAGSVGELDSKYALGDRDHATRIPVGKKAGVLLS
jgi:hypothetical protein